MNPDKTSPCQAVIEALPQEEFLYCPNPGNAGDALIACASFQMFADAKRQWRLLNSLEMARDQVVVLGGGGNFCGLFDYAEKFIQHVHPVAKRLIVLPSTIAGGESLLRQLADNVTIFCRERVSFEHVQKHAQSVDVRISHDLVFSLDIARFRAQPLPSFAGVFFHALRHRRILPPCGRIFPKPPPSCWDLVWARTRERRMRKQFLQNQVSKTVLHAFRTGRDIRPELISPDNFDLSAAFAYGVGDEMQAHYSAGRMLEFLIPFETIKTNRLHVAILAAMLGKRVALYANNYFKCKAVYEHSLAGLFPNVSWMDD